VDAALGWTQIKNPWAGILPAQGNVWIEAFSLVRVNDGDGFVHVMMRAVDVHDHAVSQTSRFGIVFFLFEIVMSLVQKFARLVQTAGPRIVSVHGSVIFNVLAIIECGALDFIDGVVNLFNGGALFTMQSAAVRTCQVRPCIPQVG
jgi:hypothetical protein